ncbi:MAG: methyltransferase domain-containing protein [Anaerolineae bacterium]|nr:methyltransferase domain-containing protein [Anaerolineae bacterium]
MTITLSDLDFLTRPVGAALLESLAAEDLGEQHTLSLVTRLRRDYAAEAVNAALTLARLRQKAVGKFGDAASGMFFTAEALEQASDPLVRRYRSERIQVQMVIDACCGIGADALALTQAGVDVQGIDLSPVRIEMARLNAAALGLNAQARFEIGDVREGLPLAEAIFFDPARRDERGKRLFDVEQYQPPLSTVRGWMSPQIVVKLSPGVELTQIEAYGGCVEFISVGGDLKEAVLWLNRDDAVQSTQATLLVADAAYHFQRDGEEPESLLSEPQGWLLEPDAAILRSGLVADLAQRFGASQLDETIAYLTADTPPESPWVRSWRILDWMPLHLKKLRAYLKARHVGRVTVKKRGVSLTPEDVIANLKLKGPEARTLVLTRRQGQHVVLICENQPLLQ